MKLKNSVTALFEKNNNPELARELYQINLRRILIFSFICLPVSLVNIVMFLSDQEERTPEELLWRSGILKVHFVLIFILLIFCISVYILIRSKKNLLSLGKILSILAAISLVSSGIIVTTIDQLVTDNITPFLTACMAAAVVILMEPRFSLMIYIVAYIMVTILTRLSQSDSTIYLTNKANSITAVAISFCISLLLWNNYLNNYNQKQRIADQNRALELKNHELSESNEIKDKLISIISHDVRQPLANALSLTEIMTEVEPMDADFHGIVRHVREQMIKSFNMTDNLLNWCKHQREGFNYIPVLIDLEEVVSESIQLSKIKAEAKEIVISNEIDKNTKLLVLADRDMISMVLRNLIHNAVKYTNRGNRIYIKEKQADGEVIIEIEDKGIGMDSHRLTDIFDSKNVIRSVEGTEGETGTGIGLQLCKEIMGKNKGKIWATSELGLGSSFYISLPAQK
ncbi:MAG: hypothetical protein K0S04_2616 [Herbinix sp.]|jgi:signal transduction histidine kinase|nr:hypothetical protein [Herbinix sp.]